MALLAVIAIHLALYGWLQGSRGWRVRHDERTAMPVTLRLLPWPEPERPPPAAAAITTTTTTTTARSRSATGPIGSPPPARPWRAAPALSTITLPADAGAVPGPPASQASQAPPLNLTLPPDRLRRASPRSPALDDPRANTARNTPEQRMATTFDTRVIEEDLGDGRRRIRRGDDCVIVKPSRIGQLMPFNEAAARSPSLVDACP